MRCPTSPDSTVTGSRVKRAAVEREACLDSPARDWHIPKLSQSPVYQLLQEGFRLLAPLAPPHIASQQVPHGAFAPMTLDPPDDPCHALILRARMQMAIDPPRMWT